MVEAGLLGLEVDHPDHSEDERLHLRGLAADLDLIVTGSSDFHGTNKTTPIGACTTDPDQFEAILAAGTGSAPFRD
jgi:3',5'-nucleoside bisphosphate phosphatase